MDPITKLKTATLEQWEKWLIEELTPPVKVDNQTQYVLEAFLELIKKVKERQL